MIPSTAAIIGSVLAAIAQPVIDLITVAMADEYDEEAEKQALLALQRKLYDERVKYMLSRPR